MIFTGRPESRILLFSPGTLWLGEKEDLWMFMYVISYQVDPNRIDAYHDPQPVNLGLDL